MMRTTLGTGLALLLLAACSSDDDQKPAPTADDKYLGLSTPENGFQVRNIGKDVAPGEDVEYCEVAEMPGDPDTLYYVNRIEFGNGSASHHLIIDTAKPGTAAEAKLAEMNVGDQVECLSSQSVFGDGFEFTGGVQRPYGEVSFPPGVGRVYHGGQRFVFDFHYYNTGAETVQARSAVNFHLTEADNVKRIARVVAFNNFLIDTPPGETRSFTGECHYNADVEVPNITRHTHRWGTDFEVWFSGGARDGESIWTSHDFQEETSFDFDEPLLMKAGEGFRFRCDFRNTETHSLRFGPNATDEMCILFSLAWEAEEGTPLPAQDCSIVQMGDDGIGRALETGSFPAPTPEQEQACRDGSERAPACEDCSCGTCGAVIAECAGDADCRAILDCLQAAGCSDQTCAGVCADTINAHSSGTGKLIQVATCVSTSCADACASGGSDAGAP
jgi:hypothetical protein